MEVLNLFPSCVYVEETKEIDNNTISKIILEKEKKEPSRQLSNRGGWQSDGEIQQDKRFAEIVKELSEMFLPIYKQHNYTSECDGVLKSMWANVNRGKNYNITHTHEGSDWSFVYYVKIPKDSGDLVLIDPRIRKQSGRWPLNLYKNLNSPFIQTIFSLSPVVGRFVIFPSYVEHYVEYNTTDKTRISISGNIVMEKIKR